MVDDIYSVMFALNASSIVFTTLCKARYSLTVLKVPLNPNSINQSITTLCVCRISPVKFEVFIGFFGKIETGSFLRFATRRL